VVFELFSDECIPNRASQKSSYIHYTGCIAIDIDNTDNKITDNDICILVPISIHRYGYRHITLNDHVFRLVNSPFVQNILGQLFIGVG
jgi:hypothetical protein